MLLSFAMKQLDWMSGVYSIGWTIYNVWSALQCKLERTYTLGWTLIGPPIGDRDRQ